MPESTEPALSCHKCDCSKPLHIVSDPDSQLIFTGPALYRPYPHIHCLIASLESEYYVFAVKMIYHIKQFRFSVYHLTVYRGNIIP